MRSQITFWKSWYKNRLSLYSKKKGDIEMDQLGKIIIVLVFLIILIYIVSIVIRGELDDQGEKARDAFRFFN